MAACVAFGSELACSELFHGMGAGWPCMPVWESKSCLSRSMGGRLRPLKPGWPPSSEVALLLLDVLVGTCHQALPDEVAESGGWVGLGSTAGSENGLLGGRWCAGEDGAVSLGCVWVKCHIRFQ